MVLLIIFSVPTPWPPPCQQGGGGSPYAPSLLVGMGVGINSIFPKLIADDPSLPDGVIPAPDTAKRSLPVLLRFNDMPGHEIL